MEWGVHKPRSPEDSWWLPARGVARLGQAPRPSLQEEPTPRQLVSDSGLQNRERVHSRCAKPPRLWSFFAVSPGT